MSASRKATTTTTDATDAFFEALASKDYEPLLHDTVGCLRIDLTQDGTPARSFITVDKGVVRISKRRARADAVLSCERALFNHVAQGKVNALAAVLRGELHVSGDVSLFAAVSRLFPGPPGSLKSFREREKKVLK